jgi:hypothetical protein
MLPIPATKMRPAIGLIEQLHAPQLEVTAGIRERYQPHHHRGGDGDSDDDKEHPTQDFHVKTPFKGLDFQGFVAVSSAFFSF